MRREPSPARRARARARALLGVCVAAWCVALLAGCPDDRQPIPVVGVMVLADEDAYQLNGQRMGLRELSQELREIADHNRRTGKMTNARAIVRLSSEPGVNYDRVRAVEEYCDSIGLDKIEKGL